MVAVTTQRFFVFSPRILGKEDPIWREHIFQLGWFNHHLDGCISIYFGEPCTAPSPFGHCQIGEIHHHLWIVGTRLLMIELQHPEPGGPLYCQEQCDYENGQRGRVHCWNPDFARLLHTLFNTGCFLLLWIFAWRGYFRFEVFLFNFLEVTSWFVFFWQIFIFYVFFFQSFFSANG